MSLRRVIARNTLFNIAGRIFEGIFSLVLTAYVVHHLGESGWGLWSLVAVFTGYAALFDFGIGSSFAKYIAEYDARGDTHRINTVVTTGLAFYFVLSAVIVALVWLASDALLRHGVAWVAGGVDPRLMEDLRFLCRGAILLFAVNNCLAPFANVPVGLQQMAYSNLLSMAAAIVKFAAAFGFIQLGWGVRGLFAAQAVSVAFFGAGCVGIAFWLAPGLRVGPRWLSGDTFRRLFHFGWRAQVAKLANLVEFQTDRMLVAAVYRFGDMARVGLYGLGEHLAMKMRQIPALLVSALVPAASALDAQEREEHLRALYLRGTKYVAAIAVPLALYMICAAEMLLHAWLGPQPRLHMAAWVMRILIAGYLFNLLPGPGMSIVLGKGMAGTAMIAGLISLIVNIVVSVVGFHVIGFYGIPLGTTLGMAASTTWFFLHARGHIRVGLAELIRVSVLWPVLACIPGVTMALAVGLFLRDQHGYAPNIAGVVVSAAGFGLAYGAVLRFAPFLDSFDRTFLLDTLGLRRLPGAVLLVGKP
jgi:O-antigen/teichoic acid export membrane protein